MIANISVYIPRISVCINREYIEYIFSNFQYLGQVTRVDFVPIGKKPGFTEHLGEFWRSAFVYITLNTENEKQNYLFECINKEITYRVYLPYGASDIFWILLKNKNPVKSTWMNEHQIVENCRFLEQKIAIQDEVIEKQGEQIEKQDEQIEKQDKQIEILRRAIYQIYGGIYCQETQAGVFARLVSVLYNKEKESDNTYYESVDRDLSKWGIWPTTRQGDFNEKKIKLLEGYICNLEDKITLLFQKNELKKEIPRVLSFDKERIKNSFDICGNS